MRVCWRDTGAAHAVRVFVLRWQHGLAGFVAVACHTEVLSAPPASRLRGHLAIGVLVPAPAVLRRWLFGGAERLLFVVHRKIFPKYGIRVHIKEIPEL